MIDLGPEAAEWVRVYSGPGLLIAAFVGATLVPVSSEAAFVAALLGGLAVPAALVWATTGNTFGCLVNYGIGRWGRERASDALGRSRGGQAAVRWLERFGAPALWLSWLPVVGDPLTLAAGAARVRLGVFVPLVGGLRLARYAALAWAV
ncbi:MAG: VTT domain-containing protein [Bacteroidota bacterium]